MAAGATIHASAVLVGARALLIRGPSGSGKSRLALALIEGAQASRFLFARLVADDRVRLDAANGRLIVRAVAELAGLIEVRGLGLRQLPWEEAAVVGLVVDLAAADAERLPSAPALPIAGVMLPRLAVAPGQDPLSVVAATIWTQEASPKARQLVGDLTGPSQPGHIAESRRSRLTRA